MPAHGQQNGCVYGHFTDPDESDPAKAFYIGVGCGTGRQNHIEVRNDRWLSIITQNGNKAYSRLFETDLSDWDMYRKEWEYLDRYHPEANQYFRFVGPYAPPEGFSWCTRCRELKTDDSFFRGNRITGRKHASACKVCLQAYRKLNHSRIIARERTYYQTLCANKQCPNCQKQHPGPHRTCEICLKHFRARPSYINVRRRTQNV